MQVKRSGFVFSLYKKNMINLWILAGILLLVFISMIWKSGSYLMNYLFYRAEPDPAALTAFLEQDILDVASVCADIEAHGGEAALIRSGDSMFFRDNVYQEGDRYRFSLPMDETLLTDTGVYYDDTCKAYYAESREDFKNQVPRENYGTAHLYFYDCHGTQVLLVADFEKELELKERERVTFAPLGIYDLYMVKDLAETGVTALPNYFIDLRDTPVDFEDDDFKDLVMVFPFVLLTLIPAILFSVLPALHPTYRQLDKFARSIQKAVDQVDQNYEEYGIVSEDKKTWYLEDWLVKRSWLKNGIEKNWKKQKY